MRLQKVKFGATPVSSLRVYCAVLPVKRESLLAADSLSLVGWRTETTLDERVQRTLSGATEHPLCSADTNSHFVQTQLGQILPFYAKITHLFFWGSLSTPLQWNEEYFVSSKLNENWIYIFLRMNSPITDVWKHRLHWLWLAYASRDIELLQVHLNIG